MKYRTLNEAQAHKDWSGLITESTGVKDATKLKWMSEMLAISANVAGYTAGNLSESYGSQGPEMVPGMGAVAFPQAGKAGENINGAGYTNGSGDVPSRELAIAMNVAAYTIGLELLPVIPMEFPSVMFSYLDYVYSSRFDASKDEQGETEIFIELAGDKAGYSTGKYSGLVKGDKVVLAKVPTDATDALAGTNVATTLYGTYLGKHRINGNPIVRFEGGVALTGVGATAAERTYTIGAVDTSIAPNTTIKQAAGADLEWVLVKGVAGGSTEAIISAADAVVVADQYVAGDNKSVDGSLVSAVDMHIPEFSKPGASYDGKEDFAATRERGEKGTQNIVSLRLFSKAVEAGTEEVLAEITKTQLKDLNAYGVDGMAQIYKAAQNELAQTLNKDILQKQFRLGVTSHTKLNAASGVNLNLLISDPGVTATKDLSAFGIAEFRDADGVDRMGEFTAIKSSEANTSAENDATRARKLVKRILLASNVISNVGRHGAGDFAVVNVTIASALQDIKGIRDYSFENSLQTQKRNLYQIGEVMGVKIYVDPNMGFNDNRILVGRKGDEQSPGLKAFIYSLAESISTISETSMAPKVCVTSRYALVPCGWYPEAQYLTFAVNNEFGI